jgi:hypothetical protein
MTLDEKVKHDLEQHPLDRNPAVLAEVFERMKALERHIADAGNSGNWNQESEWIIDAKWFVESDRLLTSK